LPGGGGGGSGLPFPVQQMIALGSMACFSLALSAEPHSPDGAVPGGGVAGALLAGLTMARRPGFV